MRPVAFLFVLALGVFREPLRELFVVELHPAPGLLSILPMLTLLVAMTLISAAGGRVLADKPQVSSLFLPRSRVCLLAPLALLAGGAVGRSGAELAPGQALWPFLLLLSGLTGLSLTRWPSPGAIRDLMGGLTAARWFYLGTLLADPSLRSGGFPSALDLLSYACLFLALHFATRGLQRVDTQRFLHPQEILSTYDALSAGFVRELCAVLPASLWLGVGTRLSPSDGLAGYLALLTVQAFLLRRVIGGPCRGQGAWGRAWASVSRVMTAVTGLGLCFSLVPGGLDEGLTPLLWILFTLGMVGGRPWGSQSRRESTPLSVARFTTGCPLGRSFWWATAAALVCLVAAVASVPRFAADCQGEAPSIQAGCLLGAACGWRFRLGSVTESSAVLTYVCETAWDRKVTAEQLAEAEGLVACVWPAARLSTVEVKCGAWESLKEKLGSVFLLWLLGLLGLLFGLVSPPPRQIWSEALALGAGLFGAFGLAGAWGWIWVDSGAALLGFGFLTVVAAADPQALSGRWSLGKVFWSQS